MDSKRSLGLGKRFVQNSDGETITSKEYQVDARI